MKKLLERLLIRFAQRVIAKYYPPREIKMERAPIQHLRWQHTTTSRNLMTDRPESELSYQNELKSQVATEFINYLLDNGGLSFTRTEENAPWGKEITYRAELMYITPKPRATA